MSPKDAYASFLLRLQWIQNKDKPTWVVSMQSSKTGELHRFPNLDTFVQFLRSEFKDQGMLTESAHAPNEQTLTETDKE